MFETSQSPNCPSCQSDETIPCTFGNPCASAMIADLLGLLRVCGVGDPDKPIWNCNHCGRQFEAGSYDQYLALIAAAIESAEKKDAPWLKRSDVIRIGIGRATYDEMLRQFKRAGAKSVRFNIAGKFEAIFDTAYESVEWPLGEKYVSHVFDAIHADACQSVNRIQHQLVESDDSIEIFYP